MPEYRPRVPAQIKEQLQSESGGKCANPGCPHGQIQLHHIKEWHVHQTHDAQHMIALCPTCHDAVHRGELRITDDELYAWKRFKRSPTTLLHSALWIHPAERRLLLFGAFGIDIPGRSEVLQISAGNFLTVNFFEADLLLLDAEITAPNGQRIVRLTNSVVTHLSDGVTIQKRPGLIKLYASADTHLLPRWIINRMRAKFPGYGSERGMLLFGAEVIADGVARINGIWAESDRAIFVDHAVSFLARRHSGPITVVAKFDAQSIFREPQAAPVPLFGFKDDPVLWPVGLDPLAGPVPLDPAED